MTIIHVSKFVSSDSLRSKHFRRLFPFLRHFAFWPRQIKACAEKEGAGSGGGGGGRQKRETLARKRHKFEKRPFSTQGLVNS